MEQLLQRGSFSENDPVVHLVSIYRTHPSLFVTHPSFSSQCFSLPMDAAALLRQRFNEYGTARDAWTRNQFDPELTPEELMEYYNAFEAAKTNLNFMMDYVRQHELLILSTVNEARAFVSLLNYFLPNRGLLNRVQIGGNMSDENRAEVRRWLENGGLTLQQTDLIFLFPPPQ